MITIRIDGSVKHYDISKLSSEIKLNDIDRIAFIIKDNALYESIELKFILNAKVKVLVISDDESEVRRGFLIVFQINLAKGLEFETVYTLPYQISLNEKYVSYMRVLNEFHVITIEYRITETFIGHLLKCNLY